MAKYAINKGVGRSVEFKGLRAQYVVYFAIGVFCSILLCFITSFIFSNLIAVFIGILSLTIVSFLTVYLNKNFGEHGLTLWYAFNSIDKRIANNKRIKSLVQINEGF